MNVKCLTQYLAVENIQLMEAITTFFFFWLHGMWELSSPTRD